jgi:hypothetical protein
LAYYFGWQRGHAYGYLEGEEEGKKKGKAEGEKIGITKGVTERVLNSIAGSKGGVLEDTEKAVREQLYAKLTAQAPPPKKPPDFTESLVDGLKKLLWWALLTGIVALVVYNTK